MSAKAIVGVIIVAILIGVLYVVFEKNFLSGGALSNSQSSSSKEVPKDSPMQIQQESSLIQLPTPEPTAAPIDGSTDLLQEAQNLEMRDYSEIFEELKDTVSNQ